MTHVTKLLSKFITDMTYEQLPEKVVETTKMFLVDYYAASFAGIKVNSRFNNAVELVYRNMGGKEESSCLYSKVKLPAMNAAFLNAVYSHGADLDDGNKNAMGHIGTHVISVALALGEYLKSSGKEMIVAINAGYEIYNRISSAAQPGLYQRGFHGTGTAGAIAAGSVAAKLLGLSEAEIYNTLALSAIQAGGLLIIDESGQACKPINPANAARIGILSAQLVREGVKSSMFPLESKKGWFHAMTDSVEEHYITDNLGINYTICDSYLKLYPTCRHTHCTIEAIMNIRDKILKEKKNLMVENIRNINVFIYETAIKSTGKIKIPTTPDAAKFSIYYTLAVALVRGHFNLDDLLVDSIEDDIIKVIEKIQLNVDNSLENREMGIRGARIEVTMADDENISETVLIPKGEALAPLTWQEIRNKLSYCSFEYLSTQEQDRLINNLISLDRMDKFSSINEMYQLDSFIMN